MALRWAPVVPEMTRTWRFAGGEGPLEPPKFGEGGMVWKRG